MPTPSDARGSRIGKYEIIRRLARGGMGELYLARDPDLRREVAIKVMSEDIMRDEAARARFFREAQAAASLQHRNIVTVFDFSHDGDTPYLVMEFLRGHSLADRLRKGPPLTLGEKVDLVMQLCEGLQFAHGEGVIHRDVKPGNIWLLPNGQLKLLDFGIAKAMSGTLTNRGTVVGSAAYMAPEQIEGQPVDARSDLFSAGVVLYELVSGQRPFDGPSVTAVMMKITQDDPAPDVRTVQPDTPASLAAIIARALQKDPEHRYLDAAEMAYDLAGAREELQELEERGVSGDQRSSVVLSPPAAKPSDTKPAARLRPPELAHPSAVPSPLPRGSQADQPGSWSPDDLRRPAEVLPPLPPRRRSLWWPIAIALLLASAAAGAYLFMIGPGAAPRSRLHVTSAPAGARISIDGRDTGLYTPAELPVERVPAELRIELAGYEPYATRIIRDGPTSVVATLREVPAPAKPRRVHVTSTPARARVVVNGSDTGQQTPVDLELDAVPAEVRVELAGYSPYSTTVDDRQFDADGGAVAVEAVLQRLIPDARLIVLRTPPSYIACSAAVGRAWKGYPFDGITEIRLPARTYPILIECQGQPPVNGMITLPPGTTARNFSDVIALR